MLFLAKDRVLPKLPGKLQALFLNVGRIGKGGRVRVILAITDEKMWPARNSQDKAKVGIPDMELRYSISAKKGRRR